MNKERIAKKLIRLAEELLEDSMEIGVGYVNKKNEWWSDKYYDGYFVFVSEILNNRELFKHLIEQFDSKILDKPDVIIILENGEIFEYIGDIRSRNYLERNLLKRIDELQFKEEDWNRFLELDMVSSEIVLYYTDRDEIFGYEIV